MRFIEKKAELSVVFDAETAYITCFHGHDLLAERFIGHEFLRHVGGPGRDKSSVLVPIQILNDELTMPVSQCFSRKDR